jgi:hypothetical protein
MIKASTLVMTGTDDRLVNPVSSKVIASLIPKAKSRCQVVGIVSLSR